MAFFLVILILILNFKLPWQQGCFLIHSTALCAIVLLSITQTLNKRRILKPELRAGSGSGVDGPSELRNQPF